MPVDDRVDARPTSVLESMTRVSSFLRVSSRPMKVPSNPPPMTTASAVRRIEITPQKMLTN